LARLSPTKAISRPGLSLIVWLAIAMAQIGESDAA
jgi:hypothetical protein